jgi:hypothetical protein
MFEAIMTASRWIQRLEVGALGSRRQRHRRFRAEDAVSNSGPSSLRRGRRA